MSFSSENGYIPQTIDQMMLVIMDNVNSQFSTSYTVDTFEGTNFYKYFYALVQRLQENEVKTSEIFLKVQEYFNVTNEMIQRPNTTHPGIFDYFGEHGYFVSTKPPTDEDAGKAYICVDTEDNHARGKITITDFANLVSGTDDTLTVGATAFTAQAGAATPGDATFQADASNDATAESLALQINSHSVAGELVEATAIESVVWLRAKDGGTGGNSIALEYTDNDTNVGASISGSTFTGGRDLDSGELDYNDERKVICNLVKDCVVAGVVSQGSEVESITMSNGQSFEFKYNLPEKIPVFFRLSLTLSENNEFTVLSADEIKEKLIENVDAKYKLGKNFEPQRYFSIVDAPWASTVLLEWTDDVTDGELDETPTWHDEIFDSEYDQVFSYDVSNVILVES